MTENPSAFPILEGLEDMSRNWGGAPARQRAVTSGGMTLRDYFAGQFLGGATASSDSSLNIPADARQHEIDAALAEHWERAARTAYIAADAMLSARQETRHGE